MADVADGPTGKTTSLTVALSSCMSVQAFTTLSVYALPSVGPEVARDLGIPETWIGHQVSIVFAAGLIASLVAGGLLERLGPTRTMQLALLLAALGLAATGAGTAATLLVGAVLLGLGYPLPSPAGAELLNRLAPEGRRNLIFSVKQMAVPAGSVLAGLALPIMSATIGWRETMFTGAVVLLLIALSLQTLRSNLDGSEMRPGKSAKLAIRPWAVLRHRPIRLLILVGFIYSTIQIGAGAYVVTLLVVDSGWSLIAAGTAAAVLQLSGVIGRLSWGIVADRVGDGLGTIAFIGFLIPAFAALLVLIPDSWTAMTYVALVGLGGTAIGWNGVYMAEIARLAPRGEVMSTTASVLALVFGGMIVGPMLLGLVADLSGSFGTGLLCLSTTAPLVALAVIVARSKGLR